MHREHQSIFSYNITRPFPFRWFTPIALVGGVAFLALFTFLNFASSGYDLIVETSSDPNATISEGSWLQHWPNYLTTKIQPKCQPVDIPVGSVLFTNQTALTYTLSSVWQYPQNGSGRVILPSLTYANNVLENCSITSVEMDVASADRSANQYGFCSWGTVVRTFATCQISAASGVSFFNLTQTYDYIPDTVSLTNLYTFLDEGFLNRDPQARASLWWGESLMSTYYSYLSNLLVYIKRDPALRKGTMYFIKNNESTTDITSMDFFNVDYRFLVDYGDGDINVLDPVHFGRVVQPGFLYGNKTEPDIWIPADGLAKSAYSTVLADLGQSAEQPNILTDPATLQYFTSNFSMIWENYVVNFLPGPASNQSYDAVKAKTGPLSVTPSVISTRYICQVPQLKSTGNLITAVLVADLVLLQLIWQLYKLGAAYLVGRRPGSNVCKGCLVGMKQSEEIETTTPLSMRKSGNDEYYALVHMHNSAAEPR